VSLRQRRDAYVLHAGKGAAAAAATHAFRAPDPLARAVIRRGGTAAAVVVRPRARFV